MERRLKHWGWGYEDQAPSATQLREAAEGLRARFGFGGEVEKPVPLEEVELRKPRLKRPGGFGDLFSDVRVRAGVARARQGVPGRGAGLPGGVREPTRPGRLSEGRVGDRDGAELGRGGGRRGGPLRRWHQRGRRGRAAAGRSAGGDDGPASARPGARGRRRVPRRADPGGRDRAAAGRAAARARPHPAPLPPVASSTRPSAAGSPPGRAGTSPRSRPTSTTWSSRCGRSPRAAPGRAGGCRVPAPARPRTASCVGSEGILGAIAEAWVRVRPRPEFKTSAGVEFADFLTAARAVREISQSGLYPSNCRLLDASEAELTGAGSGEANLLILGFESAHHPVDAPMETALEIAKSHGGKPNELPSSKKVTPASTDRPTDGRGEGAVGAWRSAFLLAPYLRDTFVACGILSETFETAITWDRLEEFHATVMETARRAVAEVERRPGRWRRFAPCQLPLHPRLPRWRRALLHRPRPGRPRRRGRAVGRDQGGCLGGADRCRRHDHPPPRGRPRSPSLVRPPAPRPLRRRPARRQVRARPRWNAQPRRPDRPGMSGPGTTLVAMDQVENRAESKESRAEDPWRANEEARRRQLREDGRRPLAVNLAEGLALSEFLSTFTGSARRSSAGGSDRPS